MRSSLSLIFPLQPQLLLWSGFACQLWCLARLPQTPLSQPFLGPPLCPQLLPFPNQGWFSEYHICGYYLGLDPSLTFFPISGRHFNGSPVASPLSWLLCRWSGHGSHLWSVGGKVISVGGFLEKVCLPEEILSREKHLTLPLAFSVWTQYKYVMPGAALTMKWQVQEWRVIMLTIAE